MEAVMSRIGRMLGLRLHNSDRPVHAVPQSQQTIPSSPNTPSMKLRESINQVTELRSKGHTYKSIGQQLGFTKQRVHQILRSAKTLKENESLWTHGLSARNVAILSKLHIASREVAIHAIKTGDIRPFKWANYGATSYTELCEWLGIKPVANTSNSRSSRASKVCRHCNKPL